MSRLLVCVCFVALELCLSARGAEPTVKPEDLPRVPPTEASDALKKFSVRPGFHVELVAAEPDVVDPIAMCFDEDGRMFVCEMRDYSERREEKLGRIRMLEDVDGDGVYEKSTVFLKDLPWPTAVMWVNGGVLVGACPDIIFAKDTDGDGVADETKVLFTGFGATQERLNVQGLFNNFIWGLDNRIHGCSGSVGGMVTQTMHPDAPPIDVRGKGIVIDPRDWSMTTEAGGGQYGLSFDHTGRLWTCSNSVHIETFMYDVSYARRNPFAILPDPRICPAVDGPAAEVFRTSPEEPWRVIRTRWRVAGLVSGPIEGGGRSAGYFTGATGITIYKGDAFGPDYVGDAFTGDAGGNLVHHKRITLGKDGITPIAQRPDDEKKIEFVSSSDNWFRPVDFANTPDGTLYIADMYRETIEHPWSIPPQIKQYLDLNSGNDRGRIWRIAPDGFKPRRQPHLSGADSAELVKLLEHPNGWHRETAARLLFERQDRETAAPLLHDLVKNSSFALARLHALHALDGLDALEDADVLAGMSHMDSTVRVHAIALSERRLRQRKPSDALWERYQEIAQHDDDAPVAYQLAFTLGEVKHPDRMKPLMAITNRHGGSAWMRAAILSSVADDAAELFTALSPDSGPILEQLAEVVGARRAESDINRIAAAIAAHHDLHRRFTLACALAEGANRAQATDVAQRALNDVLVEALPLALEGESSSPHRLKAIQLLGLLGKVDGLEALLGHTSMSLQLAALAALDRAGKLSAEPVLMNWSKLPARARRDAINVLLKRPKTAVELLTAVQDKRLAASAIDATQAAALRASGDRSLKSLALKVLPPPPSRDSVVEQFRPAVELTGDAERGHVVYAARCISCHRAGDEGSLVGPDFTTVRNSGREKLLLNILDPSRELAANYVAYLVETKDGQDLLGVIAAETPTTITIRQAYAKEVTLPRSNIKRMTSQGKSLMPDGLEAGMTPQDAADLIAFIESVK